MTPLAATLDQGQLQSITFCRNILGPERGVGKPAIQPVPGSEFEVPCRTLIFSIGQSQDTRILPKDVRLAGGHLTTVANLFVAGDYSSGNADVISAIGDGKSVAEEIDVFFSGQSRRRQFLRVDQAELTGRLRDHDLVDLPPMPMLPLGQRGRDDEVELGFDPPAGDIHAWRCYLCNYKFEIDQDKCIHCDWCIKVSPRNCILRLGELELDEDGAAAVDGSVGRGCGRGDLHLDRCRPVHPLRQLHQRLSGGCHLAAQVRLRGGKLPGRHIPRSGSQKSNGWDNRSTVPPKRQERTAKRDGGTALRLVPPYRLTTCQGCPSKGSL